MRKPPYDYFPEVVADRVTLRQLDVRDLDAILEVSYYDGQLAGTIEQAASMLQRIDNDYQRGQSIHWGIVDRSNDEVVGTCGYYRGFSDGIGEIGFVLRPAYRGRGLMTCALQAATTFAAQVMSLKAVDAITGRDNLAAQHTLERVGFSAHENVGEHNVRYRWQPET